MRSATTIIPRPSTCRSRCITREEDKHARNDLPMSTEIQRRDEHAAAVRNGQQETRVGGGHQADLSM